jgi:hypothetical protein
MLASRIMSLEEFGDDAAAIGRTLFDLLGFRKAWEEFMTSRKGPDIFMRGAQEERHA